MHPLTVLQLAELHCLLLWLTTCCYAVGARVHLHDMQTRQSKADCGFFWGCRGRLGGLSETAALARAELSHRLLEPSKAIYLSLKHVSMQLCVPGGLEAEDSKSEQTAQEEAWMGGGVDVLHEQHSSSGEKEDEPCVDTGLSARRRKHMLCYSRK